MPSWGIHLATANEILNKINIKDKNAFLIGNFIPDAERYVISDFSIFVPYDTTHFPELQEVEGSLDKLPNYTNFFQKYKNKINNPMVLGYLIHLLTDYYWNRITHLRYTIKDEKGNFVAIKINDGTEISGDKNVRRKLKHNDFFLFENFLVQTFTFKFPIYKENLMRYIKDIEETKYNKSDFIKMVNFLNKKFIIEKSEITDNYKLYTLEQIKKDFDDSINFIINFLKTNNII